MRLALITIFLGVLSVFPGLTNDAVAQTQPNSADELIFWGGDCLNLTNKDLDRLKSWGVDGFACGIGYLWGFGGTQRYTGDVNNNLSEGKYERQRQIQDSQIVNRAHARGMKIFIHFYLSSYYNQQTPLAPWDDNNAWADEADSEQWGAVVPRIRELAAGARLLGFDGLGMDGEYYGPPLENGGEVWIWSWDWDKAEQVKQRGKQVMKAIVDGFHSVDDRSEPKVFLYPSYLPDTNSALIQKYYNCDQPWSADSSRHSAMIPFLAGMLNTEGFKAFYMLEPGFYKDPLIDGQWDTVIQEDANRFYAFMSRIVDNWDYAAPRLYRTPFSWIDENVQTEPSSSARSPERVRQQLLGFKRSGSGRTMFNFVYQSLREERFNYAPYISIMREASSPEVVDTQPPSISITSPTNKDIYQSPDRTLTISGFSKDNIGIQFIRWTNNRGGSGMAKMDFKVNSCELIEVPIAKCRNREKYPWVPEKICSYKTPWDWQMDWVVDSVPLQQGENIIDLIAQDIKGLTTTYTLRAIYQDINAPTSTPAKSCSADLNGNNDINTEDLQIFIQDARKDCSNQRCRADFNRNGDIDIEDLQVFIKEANKNCSINF